MPHAVWPRTPGRDYAGTVVEGPAELVGKEVWGSGGELGIRRDGTQQNGWWCRSSAAREAPHDLLEAGAIGVPFITACGARRMPAAKAGDVVLVFGGNGKVGQAAIQIATMARCPRVRRRAHAPRPIAATRRRRSR